MNSPLPHDFTSATEAILGVEMPAFLHALEQAPPVSIRYNAYKFPEGRQKTGNLGVPWNEYGCYLDVRPSFTDDPLFHAGAYYVQEASSMFVAHIARSAEITDGMRILDLCAAPGGKATIYSELAGPQGLVVANEVVGSRAAVLADNIRKWGLGNTLVTNNDPVHIGHFDSWFDIVAVDAPCSGEGMFRKTPDAVGEWSPRNVALCAARQRRIVSDIWDALRPGGLLIYSTCTFNRDENETNIAWIAENFDCEDAGIEVPSEWNIAESTAGGIKCFRFWPHRINGEGFFAAAIRKCGDSARNHKAPKPRKTIFTKASRSETDELNSWVANPDRMQFMRIGDTFYGYDATRFGEIRSVAENLNTIYSGVCMGQMFGGRLKPDYSLAMFHELNRHTLNIAELPLSEALRYLKRQDTDISVMQEGINLMCYMNHALGWAKRIGNRSNNLYPKSQMILHK